MPLGQAIESIRRSHRAAWEASVLHRYLLFARNFFRDPIALGTVLPSSRFLVRRTLAAVPWERCRVLVEFGPGVGEFTFEILRRMRSDAVLIGIEVNVEFVRFLCATNRDERLRVVQGSAVDVCGILAELDCPVADCVISGIPFSTMKTGVRDRIVESTYSAIGEGGQLVVYQVSSAILPLLRATFGTVKREVELLNLVPVQVFQCTKNRLDGACAAARDREREALEVSHC